ncbi:MAG: deoxyribodipyrimidine photo-lyase [Proteobacteria bacterium]|nr:deoxyribodipyrimidine photo-lyase [Pseudomonadota bacterium]
MSDRPIIVWYRNELRLQDHPALSAAVRTAAPVFPVYILDDEVAGRWKLGAASRWWLAKSLEALSRDIAHRGGRLILRRGDTLTELRRLAEQTGARAIHFTRGYEPWSAALEDRAKREFDRLGVGFRRYGGRLLREPEELCTGSGTPYQVFTPFWRAFRRDYTVPQPLPAPKRLTAPPPGLKSDALADWDLLPVRPDWSQGLATTWRPGEDGAHTRLKDFVSGALSGYANDRDRLDRSGTSRLSPHLTFGEISPAACWRAAVDALGEVRRSDQSVETFLKEIVWREFSHSLLFYFPRMPEQPLREEFEAFRWTNAMDHLKAWQKGKTGYPIVDAGMRELWATGYMHNRARMITASFLTKDLLLPWTVGEAWFWDTLVDADLANNAANWQWVAGCGADAAPFFRIFNPVLQGEKFDPDGDYIRRWIPELARVPAKDIHAPWSANAATLKQAGIELGESYPAPIVDHKAARKRALERYEDLRFGR